MHALGSRDFATTGAQHVALTSRGCPSGRKELVLMVLDVVEETLSEFTRWHFLQWTM